MKEWQKELRNVPLRRSRTRLQGAKQVHSIFRLKLRFLTHTETQKKRRRRRRRQREKNLVSLTQIAVIVSVPQASSQKRGGGVKKLRWGRAHRCQALSLGEEWRERRNQGEAKR